MFKEAEQRSVFVHSKATSERMFDSDHRSLQFVALCDNDAMHGAWQKTEPLSHSYYATFLWHSHEEFEAISKSAPQLQSAYRAFRTNDYENWVVGINMQKQCVFKTACLLCQAADLRNPLTDTKGFCGQVVFFLLVEF